MFVPERPAKLDVLSTGPYMDENRVNRGMAIGFGRFWLELAVLRHVDH